MSRLPGALSRWGSCVLVALVVAGTLVTQPWVTNGGDDSIRSDGIGYHVWTRALLERDLSFCGYGDLAGAIAHRDEERGTCLNRYPPGLALLRLPVMAPLVDRSPGAPLISPAEHRANDVLGGLALVLLSALLVSTGRRLGLGSGPTTVAVLGVVLGTGLLHYGTYDASFTHVWSALLFAVLVHAWAGARAGPATPGAHLLHGGVVFLLVLIRQTNLLVLAVLAVALLLSSGAVRVPRVDVRSAVRQCLAGVGGAALALAVQLSYTRHATGQWRISSYGDDATFQWDTPMHSAVLASYERGLVTWYPLVAVAVLLGLLVRRSRPWAMTALAGVVVLALLYGFWFSWMLGGGFGHRGFVELAALLFLPLAGALDALRGRSRRWALAAVLACVAVTLELMLGYWTGSIWFAGTTAETYWEHVVGDRSWLAPLTRVLRL